MPGTGPLPRACGQHPATVLKMFLLFNTCSVILTFEIPFREALKITWEGVCVYGLKAGSRELASV